MVVICPPQRGRSPTSGVEVPSSRYLSQHLRPTRQRPLSASKRPLCRVCKVPSFLIREPAGDAARGWKRRWPFNDACTELPYRRHGLSPTTGGLASHGLRADSHDDDDDLHQHVCLSGRPSSRTNRAGDRAVVTPVRSYCMLLVAERLSSALLALTASRVTPQRSSPAPQALRSRLPAVVTVSIRCTPHLVY